MDPLTLAYLSIILLFTLAITLKEGLSRKLQKHFCALCIAVSTTWIILLILLAYGLFEDRTIIAILMGQTTLGIFYLAEHYAPPTLLLFRLPFLLTLTLLAYSLLTPLSGLGTVQLLLGLWGTLILITLCKNNAYTHAFIKRILECCKRW